MALIYTLATEIGSGEQKGNSKTLSEWSWTTTEASVKIEFHFIRQPYNSGYTSVIIL